MSHPLTACISEIELLQERIAEKNDRIEALEAALMTEWAARDNRIEALEAMVKADQEVCDSYAAENQRFFDRIEALEAALGRIARGGEAVLLNARGGITHMKNDPRLKLAMETMDWFVLNRSWLVEATNKWYSHNKGLEMVDRLHEMDAAREQLRQMYIG